MRTRLLMPAFITLTIVLFACDRAGSHEEDEGAGRADTAAAAEDVKRAEAGLLAAFKARDANAVGAHYSEDAIVATPGGPPAVGRATIVRANTESFKDPGFSVDFANEKTDVAGSGDMAYTRGTFHVTFTDPGSRKPQNVAGAYLTVFRKQADGWKAVADYVTPGAEAASPTLPLPPPKAGAEG